jgi:TonB family protein
MDSLLAAAYAQADSAVTRTESAFFVLIDTLGQVSMSRVGSSSGVRALDEATLRALTTLRFEPARVDANFVSAWFLLPVFWLKYRPPGQPADRSQVYPVAVAR